MNYAPQQYIPPQGYPPAQPGPYQQAPAQPYPPQQYAPQQGYAPQPGYGQAPVQQYPPQYGQAPQQPPAVPLAQGTLDDFYNQPSVGGGGGLKFSGPNNQPLIGQSYLFRVTRPLTAGDVQQQTDNLGKPLTWRDGRPKFVMIIPGELLEPSPNHPDGLAKWYCKGAARDELTRAMSEAGAPEGPPEAGSVIRVTLAGLRPSGPGMNPAHVFDVQYWRPENAQAVEAAALTGGSPEQWQSVYPAQGQAAPTANYQLPTDPYQQPAPAQYAEHAAPQQGYAPQPAYAPQQAPANYQPQAAPQNYAPQGGQSAASYQAQGYAPEQAQQAVAQQYAPQQAAPAQQYGQPSDQQMAAGQGAPQGPVQQQLPYSPPAQPQAPVQQAGPAPAAPVGSPQPGAGQVNLNGTQPQSGLDPSRQALMERLTNQPAQG
jgi:hypothetical protein